MKKWMTLAMAVSMLSASAIVPTQSQAYVGLVTGNLPLFVVGAVLAGLNSGVVVHCVSGPHHTYCSRGYFVTGGVGLLGLILLDGEQSAAFGALSAQEAAKLGVTDASKLAAYNDELAEINAVRESIVADVSARADLGDQVTGAEVHGLWMDAKAQGLISAEAFEVLEAVSAQAVQAFSARN